MKSALLPALLLSLAACQAAPGSLQTSSAAFEVDASGSLTAIRLHGRNLVAPGQPSPLLQVRGGGEMAVADESRVGCQGFEVRAFLR